MNAGDAWLKGASPPIANMCAKARARPGAARLETGTRSRVAQPRAGGRPPAGAGSAHQPHRTTLASDLLGA